MYRFTQLKISSDSVYIQQSQISVRGTDTLYSASDGGFHYYKGTLVKTDTGLIAKTIKYRCDYCSRGAWLTSGKWAEVEKKDWILEPVQDGLIVDSVLFKRTEDFIPMPPDKTE